MMNLCRKSFALLFLVCLLGCNGEKSPADGSSKAALRKISREVELTSNLPSVEELARNYTGLTLITKEPVLVDLQLAMLCRGVSQQDVDEARKRSGPHAHTSVKIYMNEAATDAFHDRSSAYPVGSVIVKEKLGLDYDLVDRNGERERNATKTANGVGGMIKRPAGYDPEHGDWEYFYFDDPAEVEQGKIASCVECHRGAAATDYVFGGWAND